MLLRSSNFIAVLFAVVTACSSAETATPNDASTDAGAAVGSGPVDAAPAIECTAPTSGPTEHDESISESETWTAAGSPHVLTWDVSVLEGATLTIEPCAEVLLEKDRVLATKGGTLVAEGTASRPIHIAGKDAAEWRKLQFNAPGVARLAYVNIEGGGGGEVNDEYGSTIELWGTDHMPAAPVLSVDHVTISGSRGAGLATVALATFVPGSHDLVVTGSGSDDYPYPLVIDEHAIDDLPTGSYTGNRKDEIYLRLVGAGTAGDGLKVDATLHDRSLPYRLEGGFTVAANEDGKLATLTIEPGVTMKFPKGKSFQVEHWTGDDPATGAVRALGTAERPIVLTSAEDAPAAGDWQGLWFGGVPSALNQFDHVIVEYTGADCGCSMASCSAITDSEGAVLISNYPASGAAFFTNSTFRHGSGHGIVEGWAFPDGDPRNMQIDFSPTNTFDVMGCVQTLPGNTTAGGCPNPKPACQ